MRQKLDVAVFMLGYLALAFIIQCTDFNPLFYNDAYRAFVNDHPGLMLGIFFGCLAYLGILNQWLKSRGVHGN